VKGVSVTIVVCKRESPSTSLSVKTVGTSGQILIDALTWGAKWASADGSKLVIPVSIYNPASSNAWSYKPNSAELSAVDRLTSAYESFLNIDFSFSLNTGSSFEGISFVIAKGNAGGTLGFAQSPGENSFMGVPYSVINIYHDNYKSGPNSTIVAGGLDYATYLHEFGHALGLTHPHDNDRADGSIGAGIPGVNGNSQNLGVFALNQGVNTIMGYNNGWQSGPLGPSTSTEFGYQATPMALDIMALQRLYGANLTYHLGDDQYQLANVNGGYFCIWDAGGNDTLRGAANLSNNIDLRAATGLVEQGGGGWVSYVSGLQGGFTIAVGVTIENAIGGNLADVITGNNAANHITGGGGADILTGGNNRDVFVYSAISDSTVNQIDVIRDFVESYDQLDFSAIDANLNLGGDQAFQMVSNFTGAAQIVCLDNGTDTLIYANVDSDLTADFCLKLSGHHVLTSTDFIF
jgi:serralysin